MTSSSIINHKTKQAYLKNHKRCAICGNKATTIDHIIPCQVFSIYYEFEDEYRTAVRDRENWQPACRSCNSKKAGAFDSTRIPFLLADKYAEAIEKYNKLREIVLENQRGKCAVCGKQITPIEGVLHYKSKYTGERLNPDGMNVICISHET